MTSSLPEDLLGAQTIPADLQRQLERVAPRLDGFARRTYWLDSAGSTNDVAARLADLGAAEGTVVVANAQSAGRGRMGRVWYSPAGAGLYVSVILRPASDAEYSRGENPNAFVTLAAGVALADGVQAATGLPVEIKWPNDLVVSRRKLAGILAEAAAQGGELQFIVLGFGLNLHPAAYPIELANRVTSIEAETTRPADRALILAEILAALAARYGDLQRGKFDAILSAWRQRAAALRGAAVEWESSGKVLRGRAEDIDDSGALLVRTGHGIQRVVAGEVRWS